MDENGNKYLSDVLKVLKTFPFSSGWLSPFSPWNAAIVTLSDRHTRFEYWNGKYIHFEA